MFIDPERALPFEEILEIVWKRNPALYAQATRMAERDGSTLEELARAAERERLARLLTDDEAFKEFEHKTSWQCCPFGVDPRVTHGTGED